MTTRYAGVAEQAVSLPSGLHFLYYATEFRLE